LVSLPRFELMISRIKDKSTTVWDSLFAMNETLYIRITSSKTSFCSLPSLLWNRIHKAMHRPVWLQGGCNSESAVIEVFCLDVIWYLDEIIQQEPASKQVASITLPPAYLLVLAELFFRPWRWRRYVPLKRRLQLNRLHGVISQKMILFTTSMFHFLITLILYFFIKVVFPFCVHIKK
jgi:hypothetical protein